MPILAFVKSITCHNTTGGYGDDEMAAYFFSFSDTVGNIESLKIYEEDMDKGKSLIFMPTVTEELGLEHGKLFLRTSEDQIKIRTRGTEIDRRDSNIEQEFHDFLNNNIDFDQDNFLWFNEFEITKDRLLKLEEHEDLGGQEILSERIEGPSSGVCGTVCDINRAFQILIRVSEDSRFTRNRVIEYELWGENGEQPSLYSVVFRFVYIPD